MTQHPEKISRFICLSPKHVYKPCSYLYLQCLWILTLSLAIILFMDDFLRQCFDGHSWAWDAFVARYAPAILTTVQHILRTYSSTAPAQRAEDIVQDVFVRLIDRDFRLLRTYDPSRASLKTWLTIVARSTAIDALRHKRLATIPLDQAPSVELSSSDPDESSIATEALPPGLLTPRQRLVLQLLFDREMSPEEVAELLGISTQTVRSAKHKAIQRLREHFGVLDSS